jgi:iron complex transport system substrate-binding protein
MTPNQHGKPQRTAGLNAQSGCERPRATRPSTRLRISPLHGVLQVLVLLAAVAAFPGSGVFAGAPSFRVAPSRHARAAASRVVTDEVGRRVKIPAHVGRIVSLAPNLTETLYALGLGDRLVGDTNYCDVPPEARSKPHIGAPVNPSIEAIVALRPDLVFATTSINRRETVDALDHLGISVYTSDPHTVRGTIESVGRIANLVGAEKEGAALTANLHARLDALHARLLDRPPVRALFVVWLDPLQTVGQNTFIADALRWAGAKSVVVSNQNWPKLSFEEVVRLQPEYLVFAESHPGEGSLTLADLRSRPVWRDLQAVQEGHVAIVSDEIDRPDPGLIDAIEQLARDLHPQAFKRKAAATSSAGRSRAFAGEHLNEKHIAHLSLARGATIRRKSRDWVRDGTQWCQQGPTRTQLLMLEGDCGYVA